MRTRREIELSKQNNVSKEDSNNMLILEVLLDIRDIMCEGKTW